MKRLDLFIGGPWDGQWRKVDHDHSEHVVAVPGTLMLEWMRSGSPPVVVPPWIYERLRDELVRYERFTFADKGSAGVQVWAVAGMSGEAIIQRMAEHYLPGAIAPDWFNKVLDVIERALMGGGRAEDQMMLAYEAVRTGRTVVARALAEAEAAKAPEVGA